MDIVELYERALDQAGQIVAGVSPDQFGLPTPCSEWDVRTLLEHVVGGNWNSAATAESSPPQRGGTEDLLGDSPAEAYQRSAEAVKRAWREPGRLDQLYEMPMGTLPGQAVLSVRLLETITHGWDLARATGQAPAFDDELVQAAMAVAQANLGGERPPGFPFAPAVEVRDDLPAIDRLAAFMGRQP
jgi:uncharacterized protein (TIGR03086 family)